MISRVGIRLFQVSHFVMELLPLAVRTLYISLHLSNMEIRYKRFCRNAGFSSWSKCYETNKDSYLIEKISRMKIDFSFLIGNLP